MACSFPLLLGAPSFFLPRARFSLLVVGFPPLRAAAPAFRVRINSAGGARLLLRHDLHRGQSSERSWRPAFHAGTRFGEEAGNSPPRSVLKTSLVRARHAVHTCLAQVRMQHRCANRPASASASLTDRILCVLLQLTSSPSARERPVCWPALEADSELIARHMTRGHRQSFPPGLCLSRDFDAHPGSQPLSRLAACPALCFQETSTG